MQTGVARQELVPFGTVLHRADSEHIQADKITSGFSLEKPDALCMSDLPSLFCSELAEFRSRHNAIRSIEVVDINVVEAVTRLAMLQLTGAEAKDSNCASWAILDSGASHCVCGLKEIFSNIDYNTPINLRCADGLASEPAYQGVLLDNSLGIVQCLYHSKVATFLVSVGVLQDLGWDNHFLATAGSAPSYIENKSRKEKYVVSRDNKLQRINVDFGDKLGKVGNSSGNSVEELCPTAQLAAPMSKKELENLRIHRKYAHFHVQSVNCDCDACKRYKDHGGTHHKQERPKYLEVDRMGVQVNFDFFGPMPVSVFKKEWCLVAVDDYKPAPWLECYALSNKSQAGAALELYTKFVGRMERTRADNDPTFTGPEGSWQKMHDKHKITPTNSAQYEPETNPTAERFVRTTQNGLRVNMDGVDRRLWCQCVQFYIPHTWVRLDRGKKESPYENKFGRKPNTSYFQRFGVRCFAKVHVLDRDKHHTSKLAAKYEPAVFLGYNRNSTYRVGLWRGNTFKANANKTVKFSKTRDILVERIEDLKPGGSLFSTAHPEDLCDSIVPEDDVISPGFDHLVGVGSREDGSPLSEPSIEDVVVEDDPAADAGGGESKLAPLVERPKNPSNLGDLPQVAQDEYQAKRRKVVEEEIDNKADDVRRGQFEPVLEGEDLEVDDECIQPLEKKKKEELDPGDPRVFLDANGILRKRRGRKPGTKAKANWAKPGPKPRKTPMPPPKPKKESKTGLEDIPTILSLIADSVLTEVEGYYLERRRMIYKEEEAILFNVQYTYTKCMEADDADKWIEADTLEKVKLEGKKCWRDVLEDDNFDYDKDEVIPIVTIYTRKRCGRYKCRAVALGNRQRIQSKGDIYSPTVSHGCNRYLLTQAASVGHHILQFDITLAFINSLLTGEDKVYCKLPKHWGGKRVRLLRALYGLKISPRKWYDTYRAHLETRGWVATPEEPGLFKKGDMTLSVYVDDSLISGPCKKTITEEMNAILKHFKGEEVLPKKVYEDGTEERDLLGTTLLYNQKAKTMKIHMKDYIEKLLNNEKNCGFNMVGCKSAPTPCLSGADLSQGKEKPEFPMRRLVGGLLWLSVMCRPDISFAVSRLAQFADKPTTAAVAAGKRILRYLKGTLETGVEFTQTNEKAFRETYQKVLDEHNKENADANKSNPVLPDHVGFTDSDFAGCTVTLRSTSGSVIYYKGTPIAWSSKKQSIRAHSTAEAEYCGMYDAIRVSQSQGFLGWYAGSGCKLPLIFADNQSAIAISKSALLTKKSKHFALRYMLVRDNFKAFGFCPSHLNLGDPFTKGLPRNKYLSLFDHTLNTTSGNGSGENETSYEEGCEVNLAQLVNPFHMCEHRFRGGVMPAMQEH